MRHPKKENPLPVPVVELGGVEDCNKVMTLPDDVRDEVITNFLNVKGAESKQNRFILYHLLGLSAREAGRLVGYSEKSVHPLVSKFKRDPAMRQKLEKLMNAFPAWYQLYAKSRLPAIASVEDKILAEFDKDPKLGARHPQTLRMLKETSGVVASEGKSSVPMVNIESLQVLIQQNVRDRRLELNGGDDD